MARSESCTRCKYSEEGIDRISSLPEALHSRILSLLPTKNAVATSILSKRWKFVWTCITNLTFDDGFFSKCSEEFWNSKKVTQLLNSLVQLNPPCIQNFTLKCVPDGRPYPSDSFKSLLCAAIQLTIQKFELWLWLISTMELPLSHLNCKTLTLLKLIGNIFFNVVASASICFPNLLTLHLSRITFTIASNCSVSFPRLKDMHLERVKYADEESVHKLFASCPVLDSLYLERWYCTDMRFLSSEDIRFDKARCIIISIPSLRSLKTYYYCHNQLEHHTCHTYKLKIDAPALECLILHDRSLCEFTVENLSCLINAEVKFNFNKLSDIHVDNSRKKMENISKFIRGLFNVRFLSISGTALKAIGSISENIAPVFSNLTRLELGKYTCCDSFIVIRNLLERSDNLEHLIMKGYSCCGSHESWWMEPSSVPVCFLRRVTTISLTNIGDCSDKFDLVRYFLKNAEVLELFTIGFSGNLKEKFQLIKKKISMIPRGSRACQIEFI